jgi:hypothetical protein
MQPPRFATSFFADITAHARATSANPTQMFRAHLPREERATRYVTFGPLVEYRNSSTCVLHVLMLTSVMIIPGTYVYHCYYLPHTRKQHM